MTDVGHNSRVDPDGAKRLMSIISRIENLAARKAEIAEDIKEIYAEAKSAGYTPAVLRALIRERAEDADERAEREALLEVYRNALAGLSDLPLGAAALARVA